MNFKQIINSQLEYIHCIPLWFSWLTEQYHLCSASYAFSTCSLSLFLCFSWSFYRFNLCRSLFHSFFWFLFLPWDNICYFVLEKNSSGENKKLKCFDFGEILAFSFIVWIYKTLFFNLLIGFKLEKRRWAGGEVKHNCKKCNFRALSDVGWPVPTAVVFISLLRVSDNHKFQIGIQAPVDES